MADKPNIEIALVGGAEISTSAKQDLLLAELQLKADLTETQPVSLASVPLATGASTSALQTTGNTSVGSIDTKTPALGQALATSSVPVVLTAAQLTTLTPVAGLTDAQIRATPLPISGTVTVNTGLTDAQIRATALPVSGTVTTNATLAAETTKVIGTVNIAAAQAVTANAGTNLNTSALTLETTQLAMSAKLPATLGQKAMAASIAVTVASDQATIPITETRPASATLANVASSASNVTLLVSNSARRMATFFNDSTSVVFIKFGATASATSYTVQVQASGYYEMPFPTYTGIIDGIWSTANGNMRVTEY